MNLQTDDKIIKILKVSELRHMLAHTNVGDLTVLIRKGEKEYTFCLDAVPVNKEQNKELKELYFPNPFIVPHVNKPAMAAIAIVEEKSPKHYNIKKTILKTPKKSIKTKKK